MLAPRLTRAGAVVFLDLAPRVYLPQVLRRVLVGAVVGRTQTPGCRERLGPDFLRTALAWRRERRSKDLALLEGFGGTLLVPGSLGLAGNGPAALERSIATSGRSAAGLPCILSRISSNPLLNRVSQLPCQKPVSRVTHAAVLHESQWRGLNYKKPHTSVV